MQKKKNPILRLINKKSFKPIQKINEKFGYVNRSRPVASPVFSIILIVFFIIAGIPGICFSQSSHSMLRSIKKGMELEYNFKWQQAEEIFQKLIEEYPDDPRVYHYRSSLYLWRFLSNQSNKDLDDFVAYSDTAISKGEQLLENEHNTPDLLYIMGADYSYRALAFTKAQKFLDAVWASKKSESYLKKTLQADSNYYDAYLGLGLYNFAVGQIPTSFKWALSLAGINGNVSLGLSYIKKAANKGNLSKVEAQYYLSQILSDFLFDYKKAAFYLNNLVDRYPNNLLFSYSLSVLDIKRKMLDEAGKRLMRILSVKDTSFKQLIAFSNFLMGDVLFKENKFDAAKNYYIAFIKSAVDDDYTGIANLRLGLCYEITGNREEAKSVYKAAEKGNMDIEDDIYAKRKGEILFKNQLTQHEIEAIKYSNLIDDAKYHTAYDSLSSLLESIKEDNLKAEVYIYLSRAAFNIGLYKESANFALTAKVLDNYGENWIKPFACFYAARAYKKLGSEQKMKSLINEAEDYSDYDYQKQLKNKIYALGFNE